MTEKIKIDKTLTPENAGGRGLMWVKDVIVDNEAPGEAMQNILELVKNGNVIGLPAGSNMENNVCGLYRKK